MRILATLIFAGLILASCSSNQPKEEEYEYFNLRVKKEYEDLYNQFPSRVEDGSKTAQTPRNGRALRGKIKSMKNIVYAGECEGESSGRVVESFVEFYDIRADRKSQVEWIPTDHIILMGPEQGLDSNYFETVNNAGDFGPIRAVPTTTIIKDTCHKETQAGEAPEIPDEIDENCNCEQAGFGLDLGCIKRDKFPFIFEAKTAMVYYVDEIIGTGEITEGALAWDVYAGYRIYEDWSVGLNYFSGTILRNSFDGEKVDRPVVMLNTKYEFEETLCMIPFVYGQFGMAIDNMTLDLFDVATCEDCKTQVNSPELDISIPLSWGIGFGVDLPLTTWMSLGLDLGYRSISIGEQTRVFGFGNAPNRRQVDMFIFRAGLSF